LAEEGAEEKTDIEKGLFSVIAFAGELNVDAPLKKVSVKLDSQEIIVGDEISEKFENMVWPCRDKRELCSPEEFFTSKGYEKEMIDSWHKS